MRLDPVVPGSSIPELPERAERMLSFEGRWWRHAGAKEEAIRAEFGLSATRYYQLLNAVIDSPAAMAYDPMMVRRLQRMRTARMRARSRRPVTMATDIRVVRDAPETQIDQEVAHPASTDPAGTAPGKTG